MRRYVGNRMGHALFTTHPHAAIREWRSMGWAEDSVLVLDCGEGNEEPPLGSLTRSGRSYLVKSPLRKTPDE